jgi:hypothetical protein
MLCDIHTQSYDIKQVAVKMKKYRNMNVLNFIAPPKSMVEASLGKFTKEMMENNT